MSRVGIGLTQHYKAPASRWLLQGNSEPHPPLTSLVAGWEARLQTFNDADFVGTLVDNWGGTYNLTQAGADSVKPSWTDGGFGSNDRPYLQFDGNDYLSNNALAAALMGTDNYRLFCFAAKFDATTAGSQLFSLGRSSSANPRHHCDIGGSTDWRLLVRDNAGTLKSTAGGTADTSAHIFSYEFTGTVGNVYVDGALVAGPTDMDVDSLTLDRATMGALDSNGAVSAYLTGRIAACLIYNATGQRAAAEAYLNRIYGIY